ncbi:cytosine deaminase [Chthonobacter rhizosphaerae]|uniref:cytosine deaminase n=1 Tax=Chthonobacter rhizosphaerae TaxID=2735553 RepID=UPI0015EE3C06|nr:cytosine deaminase [Chthonobacter rhizosphaerae]
MTHPRDALSRTDGAFRLTNATVPACLVDGPAPPADRSGLVRLDLTVVKGRIAAIAPAGATAEGPLAVDVDRGMVWPLFVDMHTHLDKGHIWPRTPNPDGRFMSALLAVKADRETAWSPEDVRRRFEFSLRCAYAHGTRVIRTHIDSIPPQDGLSWPVFEALRDAWAGRIEVQGVALVGPDSMVDPAVMDAVARRTKAAGGALGGAIAAFPEVRAAVATTVATAIRHGLDLDLHVDETEDPSSGALAIYAQEILAQGFEGRAVAGHCCSLARQDDATVDRTLDLVAKAGIDVVSLPICNMYLQDRHLAGDDEAGEGPRRTPRWRGVTLAHEMKARGIRVAVASDNTRDPFHAYGDLDGLEVFREATRILHLDHPHGGWPGAVARDAADAIGEEGFGRIRVGGPADLVLFRGRTYTELLARPEADRVILRDGRLTAAALPDYRDLDDLFGDASP